MMLFSIRLLSLLALAISTRQAAGVDHESMLCSNDNTPMCARSRGEYLLFKNECDLRKAQRENLMGGPLFDVALHNCVPSCEFECNDGFHPICGVSVASNERKTFRNRCEMARTSCHSKSDWLVYKWGACPSSKHHPKHSQATHTVLVGQRKRRRPIPCTNVYRPVCAGYAGVKSTFSNECLVNAENIRTRRNWRVISEGLCGEDSTKMKHSRKYKPKYKPKVEVERSKRSHKQLNQLDDFQISEDAVQIFAPSTFHTQFISNAGTMENSYSLPARKPYIASKPKNRHIYGSNLKTKEKTLSMKESSKPCVFSNEPVCGSFNGESRTFTNVCELMEYSQAVGNAWTILYDGSCRRCDKPCPTVYSPICANRNGISYTIINECYLERVRCKDPNSDWKITHKGECAMLNDEISQHIPKPSVKPSSRIPNSLYAAKPGTKTMTSKNTLKASGTASTTATLTASRQLRRYRRPTPTPKDLSNRKIRKIEPFGYDSNVPLKQAPPIKMPVTSKLWSSKDNWLLHQTMDDEKHKYNKKPSHKKAHSEKYPLYNWPMTAVATATTQPTTPLMTTTVATTTTASTAAPKATTIDDDIASAEQLMNLETESEILFMMGTTPQAEEFRETEATTRSTLVLSTTAATTSSTPSTTTTTTLAATTPTPRTTVAAMHKATTTARIETESTVIDDGTTEVLDQSTTSRSTETVAASDTSTMSSEMLTTQNLDYLADETLQDQSEQTSIYGLDKNSLIMRLLRARSSKNMVL